MILMTAIDSLPKPWRALVHEYGFKAVMQCREEDKSLEDADDALWAQRSSRQAQWLNTQSTPKGVLPVSRHQKEY
jgi:hypothetical protein